MKLRGFTLIEVLLVMIIISIVLISSISLMVKYSTDLQWNRVFNRLEQMVLDVNTFALAGVSMGYEEGEVGELPDMYHLFVKKGEPIVWYLESRTADDKKKIIYQERRDLDVGAMELEEIFLESSDEKSSAEQVLLTWSNPYARLQFYPQAMLEFSGDRLNEEFELGEAEEFCEEQCFLELEYVRSGAQRKSISFDLQKGIYRDFY